MKLNLQEENFLSKDERKEILGGGAPNPCYAKCNGNITPIPTCAHADYYCGGSKVDCCTCQASYC